MQQWRSRGGRDHYLSLTTLLKTAVFVPFYSWQEMVFIKTQNDVFFASKSNGRLFRCALQLCLSARRKKIQIYLSESCSSMLAHKQLLKSPVLCSLLIFFMYSAPINGLLKKRRRINFDIINHIGIEKNRNRSNSNDT